MPIYWESDLVVPAAGIIAAHEDGIGTTELSRLLRSQLRPSGDDLTILAGRSAARKHREGKRNVGKIYCNLMPEERSVRAEKRWPDQRPI